MQSSIVVKRVNETDIDALIDLRKLLLNRGSGHYVAQNPREELEWQESYRKWLQTKISGDSRILVLGARTLGSAAISGCGIGIIDERVPMKGCLNGRMGWIQTMVVHPEHRRKGIAKRIMISLLEWFRANEVGKVALQTTPIGSGFYASLGFFDSGENYLLKTLDYL